MKNAFWAFTHPCWSDGVYKCCNIEFKHKTDLNYHILERHTYKEAKDLMSQKDFAKYFKGD